VTQELRRDDSLPYREYILRPGEVMNFAFEWSIWLANRWIAGIPVNAGFAIRPRKATGFEYATAAGGFSGSVAPPAIEPAWPILEGLQVSDGTVLWTCQAISDSSLESTISSSDWAADSPLTLGGLSRNGTRVAGLVTIGSATADGDYYVRNTITLASTVKKVGTLLMRVRAGAA